MTAYVRLVDYGNKQDAHYLVSMLGAYALDPMGGGKPLSDQVKQNLANSLNNFPGAFSVFGFVDQSAAEPAGLINCLPSFSTFRCQPVLNIHDIVVLDVARGSGLCGSMLQLVESAAVERGCCKLTLEVLAGNQPAKRAYEKFGFNSYELDPAHGYALFWEKSLN